MICCALFFSAVLTAHANEDKASREGVASLEAYAAYKAGDYATARAIWLELAEAGNTTAMNNLANMFDQGQGSEADLSQSVNWLRKAAESGDPVAQLNLGLAYETGRGVPRNNHTAADWFRLAAQQGDVDAQFNLGVMLATAYGEGLAASTTEQQQEARHWLGKAAAQYHPEAATFLRLLENQP